MHNNNNHKNCQKYEKTEKSGKSEKSSRILSANYAYNHQHNFELANFYEFMTNQMHIIFTSQDLCALICRVSPHILYRVLKVTLM